MQLVQTNTNPNQNQKKKKRHIPVTTFGLYFLMLSMCVFHLKLHSLFLYIYLYRIYIYAYIYTGVSVENNLYTTTCAFDFSKIFEKVLNIKQEFGGIGFQKKSIEKVYKIRNDLQDSVKFCAFLCISHLLFSRVRFLMTPYMHHMQPVTRAHTHIHTYNIHATQTHRYTTIHSKCCQYKYFFVVFLFKYMCVWN